MKRDEKYQRKKNDMYEKCPQTGVFEEQELSMYNWSVILLDQSNAIPQFFM